MALEVGWALGGVIPFPPLFSLLLARSLGAWPNHGAARTRYIATAVDYYGGEYVIGNENPRWTQKPIHTPVFTHYMRS